MNAMTSGVLNIRILAAFLAASSKLRSHDRWTRPQLEAYQARQLQTLRQHAYRDSPFYQRFHAGLMDRPLTELPVLTKAILMENFDDLVTDRRIRVQDIETHLKALHGKERYLNRYWANGSSGTTGRQGIFLFNLEEWATVMASFSRAYNWAGKSMSLRRRIKMVSIASGLPWHLSARVRSTLPSWVTASLSLAASDGLDEIVRKLNAWQPEVLLAFASVGRILAQEQIDGRLRIAPATIFSMSEVLTETMRQRARQAWGQELYNQYGVSECGCLGAECTAHRGLHIAEDMVILEAVDKANQPIQPGQYAEKLLLTVLFNHTQPLIRYELGDSLMVSQAACACGRPYRLIADIEGKIQDTLYFPSAKGERPVPIHPTVFKRTMDGVAATGWQIVQETECLRILLLGDTNADSLQPNADERLSQAIASSLAQQGVVVPPLRIEHVASIPRNDSGKTPLIKSNHRPLGTEELA